MTIFEAYNLTKIKLEAAGIEDYVFEAKQIIKHITGLSNSQILTYYNKALSEFQENNLTAIIHQREIRYPLQYIFGEWDFYGRSFKVGPGVLVPRADTETLIDVSLEHLKDKQNPRILDLCAGSGCIGITLAKEIENSEVYLIEKSPNAFQFANENVIKNNCKNATVFIGDIFEADASDLAYDLIVSNPPYIPENEMNEISPETKFEPKMALLADDDGLEYYKAIIKNYKNSLKSGGMICFEVGIKKHNEVAKLLDENGFTEIKTKKDLNDIERAVYAIKNN